MNTYTEGGTTSEVRNCSKEARCECGLTALFHRLTHWNKVIVWFTRWHPLSLAFLYSSTPRTQRTGGAGGSRCRLCVRVGRTAWTTGPDAPGAPGPGLAPRPVWRTADGPRNGRRSGFCCHGDQTRTADLPLTWKMSCEHRKGTEDVVNMQWIK